MTMTAKGGVEVLQERELPKPELHKPGNILVRLKAAGVNPVDTKLRSNGLFFCDALPAILGCDGAGVVEAVGSAVSDFTPGDEVFFCFGGLGQDVGNYAEYTVVPDYAVAKKPAGIEFTEAAAAPLVLITAWEALFNRAEIGSDKRKDKDRATRVFVHAGAGGVGHVAIQLAKLAGCEVATTISDAAKADFVEALGADRIINYRQEDVTAALLDWTDGKGVDVALDTVGGEAFTQLIPAVRVYGDLVTILQVPDDSDWKTLRLRNIRLSQELMLTPMLMGMHGALAHQADILSRCADWMAEGKLRVHVAHRMPLVEAPQAHRLIEAGGMCGKIVLDI